MTSKHLGLFVLAICLQLIIAQDAAAAADTEAVCGHPVNSPRIVGGQSALPGSWPWQVSIIRSSTMSHICGASLLDSEWVLSAAHCFYGNAEPFRYTLLLGAYQLLNLSDTVEFVQIEKIVLHSGYDGNPDSSGDIALIKLASPVNFTDNIRPICLPASSADFFSNTNCWVTGWGHMEENVPLVAPATLQELNIPLLTPKTCNSYFNSITVVGLAKNPIKNDMFCAGYLEGGKDSCQGDSGGPLVCKAGGRWTQAGVVSWGVGCANRYFPGVYASVPFYADWINSVRASGLQNAPTLAVFLISLLLSLQ